MMNLLCATDLQPKSDAAVDRAHLMCERMRGRLTMLHVVPPGDAHEGTLEQRMLSAQSRLVHRARRAPAPVELVVRCGRPAPVLREVALARRTDLLIVGPHVVDSVHDALRGTFIERIVADARCPVLIARQPPREVYRAVMLALDGSPEAGHIVGVTESLVPATGTAWSLVHAHEPPYEAMMTTLRAGKPEVLPDVLRYSAESMAQAVGRMRDMLGRHSQEPRRYQVAVIEARPAAAIRRAVSDSSPDLLVLGTRGLGRFRRALFGSTAQEVVGSTHCDVLLVPPMALRAVRPNAAGARPGPGRRGAA